MKEGVSSTTLLLTVVGAAILLVSGIYLYNTRVSNSPDVFPFDPAYTDGAQIDSALTVSRSALDGVDADLSSNDADASAF